MEKTNDINTRNKSKLDFVIGILGIVASLILIASIVYFFVFYSQHFADKSENSAEALGLFAILPFVIAELGVFGVLAICNAVLSIKTIKTTLSKSKGLVIFTAVVDFLSVGGMIFLAVIRPGLDFVYLGGAIFMFAYAILKVVAIIKSCQAKEEK